jgi:hypothetical protein
MAYPEANPSGLAPYQGLAEHEPGRVYRDVHEVRRDPKSLDRLYASTGAGTFRTDDGGKNWQKLTYALDNDRGYAVSMGSHPGQPDRLFLAFARNGPGQWIGWRPVRSGPFNPPRGAGPRDAVGALCSVLRSDDAGETWVELTGGIPVSHPHMICSIETHPDDPDTAYVAYTDGHVFETTDGGDNWHEVMSDVDKLFGLRLDEAAE